MGRRDEKTIDLIEFESIIIDNIIKVMEGIEQKEKICDNCSGTGCEQCSGKGYRDWVDDIRRPI